MGVTISRVQTQGATSLLCSAPCSARAHLPGRWLRKRPLAAGVHAVRYGGKHVIVTLVDPMPLPVAEQHVLPDTAIDDLEYFYAPGDVPGQPTRGDDQRRYAEARANGWVSASD